MSFRTLLTVLCLAILAWPSWAQTDRKEIGFASPRKLAEHYRKHGREFGPISAQRYLRLAQQLRDCPVGGDVLEQVRPDGTVSRYDRASGAFLAFNRNLVIRTFFRPNEGERYFQRQVRRRH